MKNCIQKPNQKVVITFDNNQTLARIYENNKVIAKGIAICSPEDEFDLVFGSNLAIERAMETLTPKNQKWVTVNREPRPGDMVRIVRCNFTFDRVGDVIKVHNVANGVVEVLAKDHANRDYQCMLYGEDYVWNYLDRNVEVVVPAGKKSESTEQKWKVVKRKPKVGDYIRLTVKEYDFDEIGDIHQIAKIWTGLREEFGVSIEKHPKCKEYIENSIVFQNWPEDCWYYTEGEFEVVEPVEKGIEIINGERFRKVNREPKPGDYIRVIGTCYPYEKRGDIYKITNVITNCVGVRHGDHPAHKKHFKDYSWINDDYIWWHNMHLNKFEILEKL